ncbi:MAG: RagB/SusD family nutrient uptake outer membrane protein [Bacteroidota bacterium]
MKKLIILSILIIGALSACEDFLVKDPADAVISEVAIESLEDAQIALHGVYATFKNTAYYGRYFVAHADVLTDQLQSVIGYTNQLGEMYKWSYVSDNGEITGAWAAMYAVAVRASNIIDKLPALEGTVEELEQIEGEARLARAIAHFDLIKSFAKAYTQSDPYSDLGVPIIEHFEIGQPERNTIEEVYEFILDEAELAGSLMQERSAEDNSSVFLTPATADALLARVNLYMGRWNDAVHFASRVIDPRGPEQNVLFQLAEDSASYAGMFLHDEGTEVIFRIGLTSSDYDGRYIGYNYYNKIQEKPNPDYIPAEWVLNLYADSSDYRLLVNFKTDSTTHGWDWPLVWKYPGNPLFYGQSGATTNANMYKMFRLAEMYLIRAESFAEQDKDALALIDYNYLRSNRISGYVDEDYTGEALKEAIWNERQRELCFEGHHFFDLKRKGLGFSRIPVNHPDQGVITNPGTNQSGLSVNPDNNRWLWPIPDAELRANENITPNPGY